MRCEMKTTRLDNGMYLHECLRPKCGVRRVSIKPRYIRECDVMGLGDLVAKAIRWMGFRMPKRCKCKRRQEKLNKLGESIHAQFSQLFGVGGIGTPPPPVHLTGDEAD